MSFVGPTICYSFMQAAGLVNDHTVDCHCYQQVIDSSSTQQHGLESTGVPTAAAADAAPTARRAAGAGAKQRGRGRRSRA
jgi:hypothetical protein